MHRSPTLPSARTAQPAARAFAILKRTTLLALAALLPACSHSPNTGITPAQSQHANTAATQLAANAGKAFTPERELKLSTAVPIPKLRKEAEQLDYAYKVDAPSAKRLLYFGHLTNSDELSLPVIIVATGGRLKAVPVETHFGADLWQRVILGPNPLEIFGILDQPDDDRIDTLTIAHSTDGGDTWAITTLRKPSNEASFYDFAMSRDGHGRLSVQVDESTDPPNRIKPGLYHYRTTDGGKTWTAADFEPDQTKPADEVPEDEQPEKGATA